MNTLDDDLRTVLRRQADAMQVPTPIEDRPLARVTPVASTVERRWLLPAAAVVLVVVGGLALAQRRSSDAPAASSSAQPGSSAALSFETPTVRLSADKIEFGVGDSVFTPTAFTVNSDPGNAESTSLELSWIVGDTEQGINMHFASDGVSWWADGIRTYDAAGEAPDSHEGQRWFTSSLGTAWSGDLNLPNLRITNLTVEAFMRPASCDNPTSPIAVVAAYPTIDGVAGEGLGFRGRIDLIDTVTCTPVDPSPYTFTAIVDDPSIAAIIGINELLPTPTTIPGGQPDGAEAVPEQFGSFELRFLKPGQTTLRVTVTDNAGTVIGTTTTPITLRAASQSETASTAVPPSTALPEGTMADLHEQVAYRVGSGEPSLAALGFPNNEYAIGADGVTTILASDPARPNERTITIVMTPGTLVLPENHSRIPVTVVAQTSNMIRVENHSNTGWTFTLEFVDTGDGALPTVEQLQVLVYSFDP